VPNLSGVNRRKRPPSKEEPRFLRRSARAYDRGAPAKILRILGWALAIWFGSAILFGDTGLVSILRMRSMRDRLDEEIQALEAQKTATEERRDALANDPDEIERVAREEYGMIRDGEICYRIIEESGE